MVRLRTSFLLLALIVLASCLPFQGGANSRGNGRDENEPAALPVASPATPTGPGVPQTVILSPLQIDSQRGRLFAVGQVNTEPKLVALDARDGSLIAAWDAPGQLALDAARDRLVVDSGLQGVALLNATTGETQSVVSLPAQNTPPQPQVNTKTGLVYAFREATVHIIDPAIRSVVRTVPLSVSGTVCGEPSGDAPIYRTAYDPSAERLYLTFITSTCAPWISTTIVAYEASNMAEIGRIEVDINHQTAAYNKNLYGASVTRLGPTLYWAWDGESQWHEASGDYAGAPTGMAVDAGRKLIYEAIGETIRIINPRDRSVTGERQVPLLADSRLAGYEPTSDTLYFVSSTGRLYLWPAGNLFSDDSPPAAAPSPLPSAPIRSVVLSPRSASGHAMATVVENSDCPIEGGRLYLMTALGGWYPGTTAPETGCEAVATVAFSPNYAQDSLIIAAVNNPPAIMRSVDAGGSWSGPDTIFPDGTVFNTLLLSPSYANDQTLYTLTKAGLLYRSRDGGRVWQLLSQRLDRLTLTVGPDSRLLLFGSKDGRVLRSGDGGETWSEVGPTPNGETLTLLDSARSTEGEPTLYAFTSGGRFARATDGGATWQVVMETSPAPVQLAIAHDIPAEQRPVFLLHDQTIAASYDGMAGVWAAALAEGAAQFRPTAITVPPDFASAPYLFVGTADGQINRVSAHLEP